MTGLGKTLSEGDFIRPLLRTDLSAILEIECACQEQPWSPAHFEAELANPVSTVDVYLCQGEIAGFVCSWLIAGELQIQNLATSPTLRRRGIASRLLEHVLERSRHAGMETAWLEVRAGNLAAIDLYRRYGFQEEARRSDYYHDGEDALIMAYHGRN
ncbi:MAG: ribosomal protein S18-alanine N-acetyltransferase [Desulfuromonadales bacterium]|nr:ribosomal protein S18-alanine N-acetyltransferase [Desulfuromonadales bacterium]